MIGMEIECRLSSVWSAPGTGRERRLVHHRRHRHASARPPRSAACSASIATQMVSALGPRGRAILRRARDACQHGLRLCAGDRGAGRVHGRDDGAMPASNAAARRSRDATAWSRSSRRRPIMTRSAAISASIWEVLGNAYKPYPCGIVIHSAIDACLELVREHKPEPGRDREVAFDVNSGCARALLAQAAELGAGSAGQSLSLACRRAGHGRGDGVAQAQLACIQDPRVRDDAVAPRGHGKSGARDRSGQGRDAHARRHGVLPSSIEHGIGSLVKPMSDDELSAKFLSQARGVLPDDAGAGIARGVVACRAQLDNVADLLALGARVTATGGATHMTTCIAGSVLKAHRSAASLAAVAAGFRANLSRSLDQAGRALSRGRRHRCRRARRRRADGEGARPADRDRQPARRRRDRRHQCGREGRSRRLHAADHDARASDQHHAAEEAALRLDRGFRAGRPDGDHQLHPGVHPSLPINDLPSLVAYLKANPDKANYGSAGTGSPMHLGPELFKSLTGVQANHVPYRGEAAGGERHDRRTADLHAVGHADDRAAHPVRRGARARDAVAASALRSRRRFRRRPKPGCRNGRPIPAS